MDLSSGLGILIRSPWPAGSMQYNGSSMNNNWQKDTQPPHIFEIRSYEKEFAWIKNCA
jgi:hypothetical protein